MDTVEGTQRKRHKDIIRQGDVVRQGDVTVVRPSKDSEALAAQQSQAISLEPHFGFLTSFSIPSIVHIHNWVIHREPWCGWNGDLYGYWRWHLTVERHGQ